MIQYHDGQAADAWEEYREPCSLLGWMEMATADEIARMHEPVIDPRDRARVIEGWDDPRPECVCCQKRAEGDVLIDDKPETAIPVCQACHLSGAFEQWVAESLRVLGSSPIAFVSSGNLAKDRKTVEDWVKHHERITDGVCPNGCARLIRSEPGNDHNGRCPVCQYEMYSNVPIYFIE